MDSEVKVTEYVPFRNVENVKFGTKLVFDHITFTLTYNISKRKVAFSIFPTSREAQWDLLVDENCNICVDRNKSVKANLGLLFFRLVS